MSLAKLDTQKVKDSVNKLENAPKVLLSNLFEGKEKQELAKLTQKAGVYAFWWVGKQDVLLEKLRSSNYKLKGPHKKNRTQDLIEVAFNPEWISASKRGDAICLYVGKSTNMLQRVNGHIRYKVDNIWKKVDSNQVFGYGKKPNTVSQLRIGIERIFQEHSKDLILKNIALCWITLPDNDEESNAINRFFIEDKLIGENYPLFNIDVER